MEDDQDLREAVMILLTDCGMEVTAVESFQELSAAVAQGRGDCVLTDALGASAQSLDGETRRWLLELGKMAPVVLMTAHGWASDTTAGELGVTVILSKPFDLDDLVQAVGQACGGAN